MRGVITALGLGLALAGCRTHPLAPADLAAPGWTVREVAAVWRPGATAPEVPGELLAAHHLDGSRYVQFSKQGLPLVIARTTTNAWEITSPMGHSRHTGHLRAHGPPDQVLWFACAEIPPQPDPRSRWRVTAEPDGTWRISRPDTGETLEGVR